jgi:hypothetical protein
MSQSQLPLRTLFLLFESLPNTKVSVTAALELTVETTKESFPLVESVALYVRERWSDLIIKIICREKP